MIKWLLLAKQESNQLLANLGSQPACCFFSILVENHDLLYISTLLALQFITEKYQ